jgi:hypothetical protein
MNKTRVFGHYMISDTGTIGPPVFPAFSYIHNLRGQHTLADVSHLIDPTTIFEFRAGYSRFHQMEVTESAFKQNTAKLLGLNGVCDLPACWHAPYFTVTNFSTLGKPQWCNAGPGCLRASRLEERDLPDQLQPLARTRQASDPRGFHRQPLSRHIRRGLLSGRPA